MLDFVIIGAQKAGSTYLQDCMAEHHQIYLMPGECVAFEDPEYEKYRLGQLDEVRGRAGRRLAGVKRPTYLPSSVVAGRIAAHCPRAKLIAALRDPIARAISAYFHYMTFGSLPIAPIETGMQRIIEGEYTQRFPRAPEVIEYGKYHTHLMNY